MDKFTELSMAAQSTVKPTLAQAKANNYKKGRLELHGFKIAIENNRGTLREGIDKNGRKWSNLMKAVYGHFEKYIGNDGDGVDVFIGEYPEGEQAWIINQKNDDGSFDEHKVMLGFMDKKSAVHAYNKSYDAGWRGLKSIIPCSLGQLEWWLKYGNKTIAVSANILPYDNGADMNDNIFEGIVDSEELLLDSVTVEEIMEDADSVLALDALVLPYAKLERKMAQMLGALKIVSGEVKPIAVQVTDPFRQKGTTNVAAVFELSDGQTVSIFFHNPDITPTKITPSDELISWKWMLNKKDVTIIVAPEKGEDLNIREVSRRIMKLAEKNSERFKKANTGKAERMALIESGKATIAEKEGILAGIQAEIDMLESQKEGKAAGAENPELPKKDPFNGWAIERDKNGEQKGNIRLEIEQLPLVGVANITSVGEENIYFEKDGIKYSSKVYETEKYQVGEYDFSKTANEESLEMLDIFQYLPSAESKNKPFRGVVMNISKTTTGNIRYTVSREFDPVSSGKTFNIYNTDGEFKKIGRFDTDSMMPVMDAGQNMFMQERPKEKYEEVFDILEKKYNWTRTPDGIYKKYPEFIRKNPEMEGMIWGLLDNDNMRYLNATIGNETLFTVDLTNQDAIDAANEFHDMIEGMANEMGISGSNTSSKFSVGQTVWMLFNGEYVPVNFRGSDYAGGGFSKKTDSPKVASVVMEDGRGVSVSEDALLEKKPQTIIENNRALSGNADIEFINSVIAGNEDFFDKGVMNRLAELAKKYTTGTEADLLSQAKKAAKDALLAEFAKKSA